MGKKYILQLTPKIKIPLTIQIDKESPTWKFDMMQGFVWSLFLLVITSLIVLFPDPGLTATVSLYVIVVITFSLLAIRKIFFKQKKDFVVPYDLLLLLFTTTLTSSLFITTLNEDISYNIFGGNQFRIFSGVSIIALGAMYYLLVVQNNSKNDKYVKLLKYFFYGVVLATILNVLAGNSFNAYISSVLIILSPGVLWLSLKKTKVRGISFLLFLISIGSLIENHNNYLNFAAIIIFMVSFFTVLFLNLKSIKKQIKATDSDLGKIINKKITMLDAISKHSKVVFLVLSFLLIITGVIWLSSVGYDIGYIFKNFDINLDWNLALVVGSGLIGGVMGVFASILSFFGIIVFGAFVIFLLVVLIKMVKVSKKDEVVYYYLFVMLASIVHFIFLPVDEFTVIVFWIMIGLFGIFQLQRVQKLPLKVNEQKRTYKLFTDKEFLKFNSVIVYLLTLGLLSIIGYVVYLLVSIIPNIS